MNDSSYLTVNATELTVNDTQTLALLLDGYDVRESLKDHFALIEMARAKNVRVSDEDIQAEFDAYRRETGLERESTVLQWRQNQLITDEALRLFCEIQACRQKLSALIKDTDIKEAFDDIVRDETTYYLFTLSFDNAKQAQDVSVAIQDEKISFAEAVVKYGDRETRAMGGFFGDFTRLELPEIFRKTITSATPGTLAGPIEEDLEWTLVLVADRIEPEFDEYADFLRAALLDDDLEYYADRVVVMNAE
ncbi:MAG: peptidylprolyl isomerase [Magnetovibrio sp.]|nr:peptidylprolyl isomerase [Magnetovibrio sp.]